MKGFALFMVCLLWLWGMYYGYTFIVAKTLQSAPKKEKSMEEIRQENDQRKKAQDNLQRQRDLMHDRQRTMRYHQNR